MTPDSAKYYGILNITEVNIPDKDPIENNLNIFALNNVTYQHNEESLNYFEECLEALDGWDDSNIKLTALGNNAINSFFFQLTNPNYDIVSTRDLILQKAIYTF
jgi:hypothetical protein